MARPSKTTRKPSASAKATPSKRGGAGKSKSSQADTPEEGGLPSRQQILDFIAQSEGKVGKREIAKAFGITGGARIPLKRLLRELRDEGAVEAHGRNNLAPAGEMPPVAVLLIADRDADGEFIARPEKWDQPSPVPRIVLAPNRGKRQPGPPAGMGDRVLARLSRVTGEEAADFDYEARVIKVLGKGAERVLAEFRKSRDGGGRLIPVDKRAKTEYRVQPEHLEGVADGDLVFAETLPGRAQGLPLARVRESFGHRDDQRAISLIAVHAHGIPDKFPERALEEAEAAKRKTARGRVDLRKVPLITIDPRDARDHDDAVWAGPDDDPKNKDGHQVIVAIADVAAYVTPGSALDETARERGNSVYLPDRVVPMLPERISNYLCSLIDGEDRACLAVRMTFDKNGSKRGHEFMRAIMRSVATLSYGQVQAAIDGAPDEMTAPILETVLQPLWQAYQAVAKARDARGPLGLDMPEYKIDLDEAGHVRGVRQAERFETMRLIEEFMIQANVAAAEMLEAQRTPLIYRVHDQPSLEKLDALAEFLKTMDVPFAKSGGVKSSDFNRILEQTKGSDYARLISEVVLRTQAQAVYATENLGHFGLNLKRYAHFTSPIRRYADLIVHRALIAALDLGKKDALSKDDIERMEETAEHISQTERRAMLAERDSIDRFIASYLEAHEGAEFLGRISGVTRFGLFVRLNDTGADGLVPIRTLGRDYFHHLEDEHALVGERTRVIYRLGQPVRVRLAEVTPVTGGMRFELLEGLSEGHGEDGVSSSGAAPKLKARSAPPKRGKGGPKKGKGRSSEPRARGKSRPPKRR